MENKTNNLSIASITPVYNGEKYLEKFIQALLQLQEKDFFEIILVDNNSTDSSLKIMKKYPVKIFQQKEYQSSYASRNIGIQKSQADYYAFIDVDCLPSERWMSNAKKEIQKNFPDIIAGSIELGTQNSKKSIYMRYDEIFFLQQEFNVLQYGLAATANMFVSNKIFQKVGCFNEKLISSGDFEFCRRAGESGFVVKYCPEIKVSHPLRDCSSLMKKSFRIGKGYAQKKLLSVKGTPGISDRKKAFSYSYIFQKLKGRSRCPGLISIGVLWASVMVHAVAALGYVFVLITKKPGNLVKS